MKSASARQPARKPRMIQDTRAALIQAARLEFEDAGYDGTHSNKIATRAGYAPQTFYRHFSDKLEIFLAVYALWVDEEHAALDTVRRARAAAAAIVGHHRASLGMRRALRRLSVSDDQVRRARAKSRRDQIERLRVRLPHLRSVSNAEMAANLFMIERLSDACAEREFVDLGVSAEAGERQLEVLLRNVLGKPRRQLPGA